MPRRNLAMRKCGIAIQVLVLYSQLLPRSGAIDPASQRVRIEAEIAASDPCEHEQHGEVRHGLLTPRSLSLPPQRGRLPSYRGQRRGSLHRALKKIHETAAAMLGISGAASQGLYPQPGAAGRFTGLETIIIARSHQGITLCRCWRYSSPDMPPRSWMDLRIR